MSKVSGGSADHESARKWAQIFEHAGWGIRIGSADGRTLDTVNPTFARMHGYSVAEMQQMPVEALYPEELRPTLAEHWRLAREQGHRAFESWHVRKDGSRFPVFVDVTAIKDARGEVVAYAANVQDLTERYRLQAAREASDERYRVIADAASDAIITIDTHSHILVVNRAVERIFGYPPDELVGQPLTVLMP